MKKLIPNPQSLIPEKDILVYQGTNATTMKVLTDGEITPALFLTVGDGIGDYAVTDACSVTYDAPLLGGAKLCAADATSVQDRVILSSKGDRATFSFEPLGPGRYAIWSVCRFQGHSPILRALSLDVQPGGSSAKTRAVRAVNSLVNYFKAEYGAKDGRGPWKWDVALDPKTSYPYEGICAFECPDGLSEVTFSPRDDRASLAALTGGVELAGVVIMPWPEEAKFRQDLLKILCGVNCAPERVR